MSESISALFALPGGSTIRNDRKRSGSYPDEPISDEPIALRKRPRMSAVYTRLTGQHIPIYSHIPERLMTPLNLHSDEEGELELTAQPRHPTRLRRHTSFSAFSRSSTSSYIPSEMERMQKSLSDRSTVIPVEPAFNYAAVSAKHFLHTNKFSIDFTLPAADPPLGALPLSWSQQGILLFSRGNRVHYKNIATGEDVGQLCKLRESWGDLGLIECGGKDQSNVVAIGTRKGYVLIWDLASKKITKSWSTKGVESMKWNGPVLTVGGPKGSIKQYDTRIKETSKMKEQAMRVTRHQTRISRLAWNVDGKYLASGDESGVVLCWDARQKVPLDVGEFVQRRKKIQHTGAITALTWSPWEPKLLASADSSSEGKGTIRLWNVHATNPCSNAAEPGKIELDSQVTSVHFSPECKEILSTHGPGPAPVEGAEPPRVSWPRKTTINSIAVHAYPSLRHITTAEVAEKGVGDSVLSPSGLKVMFSAPKENTLRMWTVWGKRKEIRRISLLQDIR